MSPTDDGGEDDRHHDDESAFAEAMRGARPLPPGRKRVPVPPAATPRPAPARAVPAVSPFIVEQTGDGITGRARDVAAKVLRELRGGAHAVDARLDVHGRGRAEAVRALEGFVAATRARGARGLLVIHGRGHGSDAGGPILRPAVWEWLASMAAERCGVMAFASARPRDGGDGATMIWLRRPARP
jgi:DNA-nicking Smr family endonuclease